MMLASTSPSAPINRAAQGIIERAFRDLEQSISPSDVVIFKDTTLSDVQNAARDIERQLEARRSLCNMRRLEPLFAILEHYCRPLEVLCNGTPYLPFIWAPIKFILQVSSDYIQAFKQIIIAYSQIAAILPRLDRLSDAFRNSPEFQQTLAVFYSDIVRFHKEAYMVIKRSGWHIFFSSTWGRLHRRFKVIVDDLKRHSEQVLEEANALNIVEGQKWRQEAREWKEEYFLRVERDEKQQAIAQYQSILSWLEYRESDQSDLCDWLLSRSAPGTYEWVLKNKTVGRWLRNQGESEILWLKGTPGAGKSVMISKLVKFAAKDQNCTVLSHFSSHRSPSSTHYGHILRSITAQLLRSHDDLLSYVYEECLLNRKIASPANLEQLVPLLLSSLSVSSWKSTYVKIFFDGLDECDEDTQRKTIKWLGRLNANLPSNTVCKIFVASRDTPLMAQGMKKSTKISLRDERTAMRAAIQTYVHQQFEGKRIAADESPITLEDLTYIESVVVESSNEMFLYAHLVTHALNSDVFCHVQDMKQEVEKMPKGLNEFYKTILDRVSSVLGETALRKCQTIMAWVVFARRPLKAFELQAALAALFGSDTLPPAQIFDICKPLIEIGPDESLSFIHISVQEFLTSSKSGPFVQKQVAFEEQVVACARTLLSGLTVFNPDYPSQNRAFRMLRGLHGFHIYATQYWTDHVLRLVATSSARGQVSVQLLETLCGSIELLQAQSTSVQGPETLEPGLHEQIQLLKQYPSLYQVVRAELLLREAQKVEISSQSTAINNCLKQYQGHLSTLLQIDFCPGVSAEELVRFKQNFRASVFICRRHGCKYSTSGFENDKLRLEHEKLHTQLLRCTHAGCTYHLIFKSHQALKSHISRLHPAELPLTGPRVIRQSIRSARHKAIFSHGFNKLPLSSDFLDPSIQLGDNPQLESRLLPHWETLGRWEQHPQHPQHLNTSSPTRAPQPSYALTNALSMQSQGFLRQVGAYMRQSGRPFDSNPTIDGRPINLWVLFQVIVKNGGSKTVSAHNQWPEVSAAMQFDPAQFPAAAMKTKEIFERCLGPYEAAYWQAAAQQNQKKAAEVMPPNQMPGQQMSPTRSMPQTPQQQQQQQQGMPQRRMTQMTLVQANANLPGANGWSIPEAGAMKAQNATINSQRKSLNRPPGSPAPISQLGFPTQSPAAAEPHMSQTAMLKTNSTTETVSTGDHITNISASSTAQKQSERAVASQQVHAAPISVGSIRPSNRISAEPIDHQVYQRSPSYGQIGKQLPSPDGTRWPYSIGVIDSPYGERNNSFVQLAPIKTLTPESERLETTSQQLVHSQTVRNLVELRGTSDDNWQKPPSPPFSHQQGHSMQSQESTSSPFYTSQKIRSHSSFETFDEFATGLFRDAQSEPRGPPRRSISTNEPADHNTVTSYATPYETKQPRHIHSPPPIPSHPSNGMHSGLAGSYNNTSEVAVLQDYEMQSMLANQEGNKLMVQMQSVLTEPDGEKLLLQMQREQLERDSSANKISPGAETSEGGRQIVLDQQVQMFLEQKPTELLLERQREQAERENSRSKMSAGAETQGNGSTALQDYQMQLMLLEQQKKEALLGAGWERIERNSSTSKMSTGAETQGNGSTALQDYQIQLMLVEQQDKRRLLAARPEMDRKH